MPPKKKPSIPKGALEKLRRLRDDFGFYASKVLKIRTKEGELIPGAGRVPQTKRLWLKNTQKQSSTSRAKS